MNIDSNFKSNHPSLTMGNVTPASVKQQLWDLMYKNFFKFDGNYYYIDKRYESPFGFEYDFWAYFGPRVLQYRVTGDRLPKKLTNYINRKKKINKILGNLE